MCTLNCVLTVGGGGVTGGGDRSMSLCTRDTDRSPLSPDRTWISVFTHRAPRLVPVAADRESLADIAAARHSHRHLSDAASARARAAGCARRP